MFVKIGRVLQAYYLLSLFSLIFGIGIIITYYWSSGLLNGQKMSAIYEASIWLDQLKENSYLQRVEGKVREGEIRAAYNILQQLKRKISDINRVQSQEDSYKAIEVDVKSAYQSINELLLLPDISKIFQSFIGKVLKFEKFVADNNWKTLARTTSRILVKLNNLGDYSLEKIEKLSSDISSDINLIDKVSKSSIIFHTDKKIIHERLRLLKSEIFVLSKYTNNLKSFLINSKKLESSYKNWHKQVTPLIDIEKTKIIKKANFFTICLFLLLGMASIFVLISVFIFRKNSRVVMDQMEDYALDVIKNRLLAKKLIFNGESTAFQEEFKRSYRYIHRYMSLGNIFDKALPFGAVLLDSNLNISWANNEFYQSWNISEKRRSQGVIEWKYIHRLTNLGDSDPVFDGIQNLIGGTYQIKNKAIEAEPSSLFEMHVSPIEYSAQRWVMVFFYPLSSMHNAITEQAKSIIKPVKSSLKFLPQLDFTNNNWENMQEEFAEVGAEELFYEFKGCWKILKDDRRRYLNEVVDMERQLSSLHEVFNKVFKLNIQANGIQGKSQSCILELKKDIISLSDNFKTGYVNECNIISHAQSVVRDYGEVISVANDFEENIDRGLKACLGLEKIQVIFSGLAKSFEDHHCKIYESVNQLLILNRTNKYDNLEKVVLDLRSNIKVFDEIFKQFLKSSRVLEIVISKMNIVIDKDLMESNGRRLAKERSNFDTSFKEFQALIANHKVISSNITGFEEKLVDDLRDMYKAIVQVGAFRASLANILDENKRVSYDVSDNRLVT